MFIGYADNTGYSACDHLHFEVKPLDADGTNKYAENGFFGGVDPWPLVFEEFAPNIDALRKNIEKLALQVQLCYLAVALVDNAGERMER